MKIISPADQRVMTLLKTFRRPGVGNRLLKYCVQIPVKDGVLLYNLLTCELLLLTPEEFEGATEMAYLKANWFLVPDATKEKDYVDFVRKILRSRKRDWEKILTYTIFTTTDCNARCFYCFERGCEKKTMTIDTAEKVVRYIKNHCGNKTVSLRWFGGEPLMNCEVIDWICQGLRKEGIMYQSSLFTNGYLLDDRIVNKAVQSWNLKNVQITLDGTEKIYNRTKAYIYLEGNPYQIVLNNIDRFLNASIKLNVRLNMDIYNAEDLQLLVKDLVSRFGHKKGFAIYPAYIFNTEDLNWQGRSQQQWQRLEEAMERIDETIEKSGVENKAGIDTELKLHYCMADSGRAITILPDGKIGLCEHYTDDEFIGDIGKEEFNQQVIQSWTEPESEISDCDECLCYPQCVKIKKCNVYSTCIPPVRKQIQKKIRQQMKTTYQRFIENNNNP